MFVPKVQGEKDVVMQPVVATLQAQATPQHTAQPPPIFIEAAAPRVNPEPSLVVSALTPASAEPVPPFPSQDVDMNGLEDRMIQYFMKMDDAELVKKVGEAKQHPRFPDYMDGLLLDLQGCGNSGAFGQDYATMVEELAFFHAWLKQQEDTDTNEPTYVDTPPPEVESQPAVPAVAPAVVQATPSQAVPAVVEATPSQAVPAVVEATPSQAVPAVPAVVEATPSQAVPAVVEATQSQAAPAAVTAASPAASGAMAMQFKPVTAEGIASFWSVMRRKSTDDLSMCSTPAKEQDLSAVPLQRVPIPQILPSEIAATAATGVAPPPAYLQPQPQPKAPVPATPPAAASPAPTLLDTPVPTPQVPPKAEPAAPPVPPVASVAAPAAGSQSPQEPAPEGDRASYMRYYRSVRSGKCPEAVNKNLELNYSW